MSVTLSINGTNYSVPTTGDVDWAGGLSSYLSALAAAASSVLMFGNSTVTAGAGAFFLRPGYAIAAADTTEVSFRVPFTGRLKSLYVRANTAGSGGSDIITVRLNSLFDTPLACSLAPGLTAAQNTIDSVQVSAGDAVSIRFQAASTTHPLNVIATLALVPS